MSIHHEIDWISLITSIQSKLQQIFPPNHLEIDTR